MRTSETQNSASSTDRTGPDPAGLVTAALLLAAAGVIWWDLSSLTLESTYGLGPKAMPAVIAIGLAALALGNVVEAFRSGRVARETVDGRAIVLILGGLAVLVALIGIGGGFIVGVAILFAATAAAFGRRAVLVDLAIGLALGIGIYLLFSKLLTLSLPVGPLERLI